MIQYFAVLLMTAELLNLEPHEYVHVMSDAHLYANQYETAEEILKRETRPFPKLILKKEINSIEDFFATRHTDFELEEYNPHPEIKFEVTV